MNDYRIIAKDAATGDDLTRIITERSDKAARQAFDKMHRDTPHEITGSELVKENTTATKQQERDALAKIRAMVEELGPDSYLAAAFAGCFELADQNIEYDFGDSMKARAESANLDAEKAQKELAAANARIAELEKSRDGMSRELQTLRKRTFTPGLYKSLYDMVSADLDGVKKNMAFLADGIADNASNPDCDAFKDYVRDYKAARELRASREWQMKELKAIAPEDAQE